MYVYNINEVSLTRAWFIARNKNTTLIIADTRGLPYTPFCIHRFWVNQWMASFITESAFSDPKIHAPPELCALIYSTTSI